MPLPEDESSLDQIEGGNYNGLDPYWTHISRWKSIKTKDWLSYKWQVC